MTFYYISTAIRIIFSIFKSDYNFIIFCLLARDIRTFSNLIRIPSHKNIFYISENIIDIPLSPFL